MLNTSLNANLKAELKAKGWNDDQINKALEGRAELEKNGGIRPIESRIFLEGAGGPVMDIGTGPKAAAAVYAACNEYRATIRK